MGKNTPFRFKRFQVEHRRSSMKVGIDAVVLGAWIDASGCSRALEVGCGCGVISLMLAQRWPTLIIDAIDIHAESVIESSYNFCLSEWGSRLKVARLNFLDLAEQKASKRGKFNLTDGKYDLIVSNPPYFDSGIVSPNTPRLAARHVGELSPFSLLDSSRSLLSPGGVVTFVTPGEYAEEVEKYARGLGYRVCRTLHMIGREGRDAKRVFYMFRLGGQDTDCSTEQTEVREQLIVEDINGNYTDQYKSLCREFYLKF